MQIKTIQTTISKRLTEWLDTITDKELVKKLKKNVLVSGGSITSMLLNEPVNDYDVYINDIDVLKDLVVYYIKPFNGIEILDGRQSYTETEQTSGVYGISVSNLKPDQIKLFFNAKNGGLKVYEENKIPEGLKYTPIYFSPNAISLSDQLQIVIRFHGDNEAIHKTFDFIHATNYFTFEDGLVTNKSALESIITKQLKYQGSLYPLTSIIRMKKFIKRNWNINAGEILKIMFQISELDLKNPNVLEEQLIGVDVAYFAKLIEILRDVKGEKLTSEYLNAIIDKVFNQAEETE